MKQAYDWDRPPPTRAVDQAHWAEEHENVHY